MKCEECGTSEDVKRMGKGCICSKCYKLIMKNLDDAGNRLTLTLEKISKTEVNDLISQNDKKLIVSGQDLTFTPTTKDKILISSIEYKIIQIDVDSAENTDVVYIFYLRT